MIAGNSCPQTDKPAGCFSVPLLNRLTQALPPALASPVTRRKLLTLFRTLPALGYRSFGFETKLDEHRAGLDAAFCINKESAGLLNPELPFLQEQQASHHWWAGIIGILNQFCPLNIKFLTAKPIKNSSAWSEPIKSSYIRSSSEWAANSCFSGRLKNLWLEYDLEKSRRAAPLPKLFAGLKQGTDFSPEDDSGFLKTFLGLMNKGKPVSFEILKEILNLLPRHQGKIFQLGLSPYHDGIRLCLSFPVYQELLGFLSDLGLPACPEYRDYLPALGKYALLNGRLHLDIAREISAKIGIEYHLPHDPFVLDNQRLWEPVLTEMTKRGLCLEAKRAALVKWPGWSYEFLPGKEQFITYRFLYYLKVLLAPGRLPELKGYFGFVNREIK